MKDRFKFEDKIYNISAMVEPKNTMILKPKSPRPLFARFPILTEKCCIQKTDAEWRSQAMTDIELPLGDAQFQGLSDFQYWMKILRLKTRNCEIKYPDLRKCISLIFSLCLINIPAECLFRLLKLIKTYIKIVTRI